MPTGVFHEKLIEHLASHAQEKQVSAATTLKVNETMVNVTLPGSSTYAITLPPVAETRGITFTIFVGTDGAGTATVQDQDDTPVPYTSSALTALHDRIVVYSDGRFYHQLIDVTT